MSSEDESNALTDLKTQLENTSKSFSGLTTNLSNAIIRFENWINMLPGKSDLTLWRPDDADENMEIGLRIHRSGKEWVLSYASRWKDGCAPGPRLGATTGTLGDTLSIVSKSFGLHGDRKFGPEWCPLRGAPVSIKVAAVLQFQTLLQEMVTKQERLISKLETAFYLIEKLPQVDEKEGK